MKVYCALLSGLLAACITACTFVGAPDNVALSSTDFGPVETLRICVELDEPWVSQEQGEDLIHSVAQEMAIYKIHVTAPMYSRWTRPSNTQSVLEMFAGSSLHAPCDRLLILAGPTIFSFLLGLVAPIDQLGAVDTVTNTRGYVGIHKGLNFNQLLISSEATAIHEVYHMLGCQHDAYLTNCYERIRRLKNAAMSNRKNHEDFFPTYSYRGQFLRTRAEVNLLEENALRIERLKQPKLLDE